MNEEEERKQRQERLKNISKKLKFSNLHEIKNSVSSECLTPSPLCDLCSSTAAHKINEAWLNKPESQSVKAFVKKWSNYYEKETGKKLQTSKVNFHFEHHFNAKGAAALKYNQLLARQEQKAEFTGEKVDNNKPMIVSESMKRLYGLLEDKYLNDLKLLDFTVKEQLEHLKEIKAIKEERQKQDIPAGIEGLIMKEEDIVRSIQNTAIHKIKTFQTSKLQQAQTNVLNTINSTNSQVLNLLGMDPAASISPALLKQSQFLFVNTVIKHLLKRLSKSLDIMGIATEKKAMFYGDLKKQLKGIEEEIFADFTDTIKDTNMIAAETVNDEK